MILIPALIAWQIYKNIQIMVFFQLPAGTEVWLGVFIAANQISVPSIITATHHTTFDALNTAHVRLFYNYIIAFTTFRPGDG